MKGTYSIIRNYLLNGVFAYALFGLYAVTLSPIITQFLDYGEKNIFISIFGFIMLISEFFALNFKLKMVRFRSEEKRIAYKKETGINIIPSTSPFVFFGFFLRLVFRVSIIMVSMTALGYPCTEKVMSPQGLIVLMIGVMADLCGFIYIYFKTGFYTDPPQNKNELKELLQDEDDWDKANIQVASSEKYARIELLSDIILQVYALMLFTTFWKYINQTGIEMLHTSMHKGSSSDEIVMLFLMLFCTTMLGLMPIRIAYWIEDSMEAFTKREKYGMWVMFFTVAIFTCSPVIIKFISLFIMHFPYTPMQSENSYTGYLIAIVSFITLLFVQILLFGRKTQKENEEAIPSILTNESTINRK